MLCDGLHLLDVLGAFVLFKQKTAYEMRISDWSSDVCSSDLLVRRKAPQLGRANETVRRGVGGAGDRIGRPQRLQDIQRIGLSRLRERLRVEAVDRPGRVGDGARTPAPAGHDASIIVRSTAARRAGKEGLSRGSTRGCG